MLAGAGLVIVATVLRAQLGRVFPHLTEFGLYYPAVLAAGLLGGWPGAVIAVAGSVFSGWFFFVEPRAVLDAPTKAANMAIFLVASSLVGFAGARIRTLIRRYRQTNALLAERELRYRTLFECVSDGFLLIEPAQDALGRTTDYLILEANPAILRILSANTSIVGRRVSEVLPVPVTGWLEHCNRATAGDTVTFDFQSPATDRWYEIHLSRVGRGQLAAFIVDVTDRKLSESRHLELFEELNHRVKNNLSMVSVMLSMHARASHQPEVQDQLQRAIDRIQAIADVHASLYRSSSRDDVDFAGYLQQLCDRLSGSLLPDDRIRIELDAQPATSLPLDRAVALGVVVNELVTNAVKHAYPPPARGVILVKLRHAGDTLTLSVSDNGRGLPPPGSSEGLGMRLIRSLVQQAGAILTVEQGEGVTFVVRLREADAPPFVKEAQSRLL
ncbi:sensor histidine kinase [Phenylobacterium hankyongense]|uniref:sensor histidine kinase n=1 Tax=Phenylobacterium hankyongense TaxID=1813876 RepID=UPI001403E82F|nr:histidine kinase dimerization/phosphoacceptor domain -containing protein [Phenylobacterium hankyongense]